MPPPLTTAMRLHQSAEVVEIALTDYVQRSKAGASDRVGLSRLLEADPLKLTHKQFRASMEALGTMAPAGSAMVPVMVPRSP